MVQDSAVLGTIVRAVGRGGEIKLLPSPDFWPEALQAETLDLVSGDETSRPVRVEGVRSKGGTFILKLAGFDTIDDAEGAVGCLLNVSLSGLDEANRPKRPMPFQLMGLEVHLPDGTRLGEVVDMVLGSAQHCLIVENGDERFLVPDAPGVIVRIDREGGVIDIDPPEGLLELRW